MKWEDKRQSDNVEDRRGRGGFRFPFPRGGGGFRIPGGGGGGLPPMGGGGRQGGGVSIITLIIIMGILWLLGVNPLELLQGGGGGVQTQREAPSPRDTVGFPRPGQQPPADPSAKPRDREAQFVAAVLGTTEDVWTAQFAAMGLRYSPPKLVIFEEAEQTGCGTGVAQMGPFYCPLDQTIYIDLSFFRDLKERFKAPGDFAQAYVIAHEVGHHVQTLLGVAEQVTRYRQRASEREGNAAQVRMELQADCYAGLWAHQAEKRAPTLEPGDVEEALGAASAIGDDRLQRQTQGRVTPDSFTHGTSDQRARWFRRGLTTGEFKACDTFNAPQL